MVDVARFRSEDSAERDFELVAEDERLGVADRDCLFVTFGNR